MNDIERQILLNQIAIMEALLPLTPGGPKDTRDLLQHRYRETAKLIRAQQGPQQGG